jgi:hypothetical protein
MQGVFEFNNLWEITHWMLQIGIFQRHSTQQSCKNFKKKHLHMVS